MADCLIVFTGLNYVDKNKMLKFRCLNQVLELLLNEWALT